MKHYFPKKTALVAGIVAAATGVGLAALPLVDTDLAKKPRMKTAPAHAVVKAPSTVARAWVVRDRGNLPLGLASFRLDAPGALTSIAQIADKAYAGAMTPEGYIFYRFREDAANQDMQPIALSRVDPQTGQVTDIANWSNKAFILNDMAWDHKSGALWGMARQIYTDDFLTALSFEYSSLYRIDPATGVATEVRQYIDWPNGALVNPTFLTLAADLEGNLYTIDINGYLMRLDADNNYEAILIGDTGRRPAARLQTMDYDPVSGCIYWAADYKSLLADLVMIDPATGKGTVLGLLGSDSRLAGLAVDYQTPREGAPAAVSELLLSPETSGLNEAGLTFKAPAKTFGGQNLASISRIDISRDGAPLTSLNAPVPGESLSYTDRTDGPGFCTYTVTPVNALGNGMVRSVTAWVGEDTPGAPLNPGLGRNDDGSAYIVWTAPEEGRHGGVFDHAGVSYELTRHPDGVVVTSGISATEYTDATIPSLGRYSYTITPLTAAGRGEEAQTPGVELGNGILELPWNCQFADQSVFNTWTVINNNGGSTWEWKRRGLADYDAFAMYRYDNDLPGDDYLVSPGIRLREGGVYQVKFNYRGSNANYKENFEVCFGEAPTVEGLSIVLGSYTTTDGEGHFDTLTLPAVAETGIYHIAFHAVSEPAHYNLYITDVTVSQISGPQGDPSDPTDLPAPHSLKTVQDPQSGYVSLSWSLGDVPVGPGISQPIAEDWESYQKWTLNPSGCYEWSYIDADGGKPYKSDFSDMPYPTDGEPLAAMIMAPYELERQVYEPNPPHSGDQYLLFKSNYAAGDGSRPAPVADDWLISPRLDFEGPVVFSFWCKADPDWEAGDDDFWGAERWNTESFQVGYSMTDADPGSFVWMSDAPESITSTGADWREKEYAFPEGVRHVAIRYCTPTNGFWFMVDDIYIGPASGRNLRTLVAGTDSGSSPSLTGFDVFMDGNLLLHTPATSCIIRDLSNGTHTFGVKAIYAEGESALTEHTFTVQTSGAEALEDVNAAHRQRYDLLGRRVSETSKGIVIENGNKTITQ